MPQKSPLPTSPPSSSVEDPLRATVSHFFIRAAAAHPERALFRSAQGTLTYGEAARYVARGITELEAAGVRAGERVVCYLDSTIPLGLFILSCGLAKILPVPLSPVFSKDYLRDLTRQAGARWVFTIPRDLPRAEALDRPVLCSGLWSAVPEGTTENGVRIHPMHGPIDDVSLDDAMARLQELSTQVTPSSILLLQPTSGSTGRPKLVRRQHTAFCRYAKFAGDEVAKVLGDQHPRILLVNALTHAFAGHMFSLGLRLAGEFVIPSRLDTACALTEVRDYDPSVVTMTPRVLQSFAAQQRTEKSDRYFGPSAKVFITAGGQPDPTLVLRLRDEGLETLEIYGSSEASIVALTPAGGWRRGYAGRVVPDARVRISPKGEIQVQSPGLMQGYFGDDELTELVFTEEGYYRTGDMGRIDDGYLRILGRLCDVFNTPEGSNIYPERIELMIEALDEVKQAFLIGDGHPFVTAHLVLRRPGLEDGFLSPDKYGELYDEISLLVAETNRQLEAIERIVAICLYGSPFQESVYRVVNVGKVARNRQAFVRTYAETVEHLYSPDLPKDSPALVPPQERRYTLRVWPHRQS